MAIRIVLKHRAVLKTQIQINKYTNTNTKTDVPWLWGGCVSHVAIAADEENYPGSKDGWDILQPQELNVKLAKIWLNYIQYMRVYECLWQIANQLSWNAFTDYQINGNLVKEVDVGNHGYADEEVAKVGEHYQHLSTRSVAPGAEK